jgi:hypothetical protein
MPIETRRRSAAKNMCNALSERFQHLRSSLQKLDCNVQQLKSETEIMGGAGRRFGVM